MKNILLYTKFQWVMLLLLTACMHGCKNDSIVSEPQQVGEDESVIMIRALAGNGLDKEKEIHTLRLFVFAQQSDGTYKLVLNNLFDTSTATPSGSVPSGFVEYFVKNTNTGGYDIAKILKKNTIRIVVVANELTPLNNIATIEDVRHTTLDFFDTYGGGTLDIKIDNAGPVSKGYIPMYAETEPITPYEWDGLSGKVISLDLVRTLAKVTLQITGINVSSDPLAGKGTISINSASIVRVPQLQQLGVSSEYGGNLVNTALQQFDVPVTSTPGGNTSSNLLTFYIPEYVVSETNKDDGLYSYIQLNALYTAAADGKQTVSTYKILLGDGMENFYTNGSGKEDIDAAIGGFTKEDLTISRNKHYNYNVSVSTTGALAVMKVLVGITPWEEQDVVGDIDKPSLSLSSIDWTYDPAKKNRIYFWTNVAQMEIMPEVKVDNNGFTTQIGDVFSEYKITQFQGNDLVYPYNGYIDFVIKPDVLTNLNSVVVNLNAGGLKRYITMTKTP